MSADSQFGQVIDLSAKRLVQGVPRPDAGNAVLRDMLVDKPFDASATGFVLACLGDTEAPVMWVSDRMSRRENGRLYGPALRKFGFKGKVLRIEVSNPRDVLWAMEEGAGCAGLSAVVGEIHGAPEVLSFTATKRLAIRAEASKVPIWLIRSGDPGALSAARERWRISALPSDIHPYDSHAPGLPVWEADLFRARGRSPGVWQARYDPNGPTTSASTPDRLRLVPRPGDGPLAQDHRTTADIAGG